MAETLIEVKNLKKYFETPGGMLHAVDDVSLKIGYGETLGIVGESGCGKSTLGRVIMQLQEATSGQVLLDGNDITKLKGRKKKELYKSVQMIFQDPYTSLNPRMSVSEIVSDPLKVCKLTKNRDELRRMTEEVLEEVGLPKRYVNTYPHELDGGRRQRVGLARALVLRPRFIVCDEPVSALDVSIQAQILNLLMDLQEKKGISYMFITHDLCVVRHISDYIAVMYMGQVVEYAPKEELFLEQLHPYTKALLTAIPLPTLASRDKKRTIITGEVANPINPKPECRFYNRCSYASEKCKCPQELREIHPGHYAACSLL